MRITIMGAYGYGNFGDEIMLEGILTGIRRTLPGANITVLSGDSKQTGRAHNVHAIDLGNGAFVRLQKYWELVRSDLLIVGGGNLRDHLRKDHQSSQTNALSVWLGQVILAHEIGVPTMCYAVSIGHILTREGRAALKDCLEEVDAISVRDSASATRIAELGVSREVAVVVDAAFSAIPKPQRPEARRGIVLALRHWYERGNYVENPEEFARMIREIAEYCDAFIERYREPVWLVPFKTTETDDDSDTAIHRQLLGLVRHQEEVRLLEQVPELGTVVGLLASARLVLGMRLHSIIIATAVGTPWISINYDPKVRSFAQYAGQGRFSLEVEGVSSRRLSELTEVAIADEAAISSSLATVSDEFRSLEKRNAELAREVLLLRPAARSPQKVIFRSARLLRHKLGRGRTRGLEEAA